MPNPADNPIIVKLVEKIQVETDPVKVTELTAEMCRILDLEEAHERQTNRTDHGADAA
jgi:hypothetical protein